MCEINCLPSLPSVHYYLLIVLNNLGNYWQGHYRTWIGQCRSKYTGFGFRRCDQFLDLPLTWCIALNKSYALFASSFPHRSKCGRATYIMGLGENQVKACRWKYLLNQVCQKEKNEYCILMHMYEIQKEGTDEPVSRAGIETQMWRMNMWLQEPGRRGWDKLGDWDWWTYTTMCEIISWWEPAVYSTESSALWWLRRVRLGGWEGGSRGGYMCIYSWFTSLYSRNQHNIVKQLYSN